MGTNYYVRPEGTCATQCDNWIHLGKKSAGWAFIFAAHNSPELTITDYPTWLKLLGLGEIYDEYGTHRDREYLLQLIERGGHQQLERNSYLDPDGHMFMKGYFS